jgi:hypothetical protein
VTLGFRLERHLYILAPARMVIPLTRSSLVIQGLMAVIDYSKTDLNTIQEMYVKVF